MKRAGRFSSFAARAVFDQRLTATDLRILAALGTYTDDEGWCFPNQTTLAERLSVTRQTISSAISKLVECGYVAKETRTAKGRGKVGYDYRVLFDLPREESVSPDPVVGEGRCRDAPMSAKPVVGEDTDPLSAHAELPYKNLTLPTEQTQLIPLSEEKRGATVHDLQQLALGASEEIHAHQSKAKAKARYTAEFEAWWKTWPVNRRKNGDKQLAFRRWKTGLAEFGVEPVLAASRAYLADPEVKKQDFKFCCLPEVFMNGKLEAAVEAAMGVQNDVSGNPPHDDPRWTDTLRLWNTTGQWRQGMGCKPGTPKYTGPNPDLPHFKRSFFDDEPEHAR